MHHSSSKRIGRVAFLLEVVADGRQLQGQASVYELTEKSIISDAVTYERTRDATGELAEQRNGWGHVTQESLAKERRLPMTSRVAPILENAHGPDVEVAFAGGYPEGSPGNRVAADMSAVVARAVETLTPAAVIFDLVGLRYTWGDAICSIVMPLRRQDGSFTPSAIVATGRTRRALAPLLAPPTLLGLAGCGLYDAREAALRSLL